VRALVRVHTYHHCCHMPRSRTSLLRGRDVAGMPNSRSLAPLSSHATARPGRLAPRYRARPGQYNPGRQAVREPARRTSRTLRHNHSALRNN
jgi:hypothetical protein